MYFRKQLNIIITILGFIILLSSCKTDESFPSLNDLVVEFLPGNNQSFVPIEQDVKVLIHKISHEHSNDIADATLQLVLWLEAKNDYIAGTQTIKYGDVYDTIVFTPEGSLPRQSDIKVNFEATWTDDNYSVYGEPAVFSSSFTTVPYTIPNEIIRTIYPENNTNSASTFTQPIVSFAFPVSETIVLNNVNYKYELVNIKLLNEEVEIPCATAWNELNDKLTIKPNNALPAGIWLTIKCQTQLMVQNGSYWEEIGSTITKTSIFQTTASNSILLSNDEIEASYPIARQYNFHINEYDKGYLKPKTGYSWISDEQANYSVKIYQNLEEMAHETMSYIANQNWFEFNIPTNLDTNTIYRIEFIREINSNATIFYQFNFKTSIYDTFTKKINSFNIAGNYIDTSYFNGVYRLTAILKGKEHFDRFEMNKIPFNIGDVAIYKSTGLVNCEANLEDQWYQHPVIKAVYTVLEDGDMVLKYRDNSIFDIPPKKAVYLSCISNDTKMLTDDEIESNNIIGYDSELLSTFVKYDQNLIVYTDYYTILNELTNMSRAERNDDMEYITLHSISSPLALNSNGENNIIHVKLKYTIPCVNFVSSKKEIVIFR